jgi:dienelactone hydrolase
MTPESCDSEVAIWFAQHQFASVFVLRLGYGESGGPWTEGYKTCSANDYAHAGWETARQIDVIVNAVKTLDGFNPHDVVVVGQSAGGWGTIAYASKPHPDVAGLINMAGGRGGHYHDRPNSNCQPEHLVDAVKRYGATASSPMLWVYAKNDSFFNPELAQNMFSAFEQAGGHATFVAEPAFGQDGHNLFSSRGGSRIWGPLVEKYLAGNSDAAATH